MTAYRDESFNQNEDFTSETVEILKSDGVTPEDLVGATFTLKARYGAGEAAPLALTLSGGSFIVDTGASTVAYKVTAAQALGLTPSTISYTMTCQPLAGGQSIPLKGVWRVGSSEA